MSNYQDIYRDLPSRVYEVWQRTKTAQATEAVDRSVTAMLMAAAAGLAMPFENLKDVGVGNRKDWNSHPAFNTTEQSDYQNALKKCKTFFDKPVAQCPGLQRSTILCCQNPGCIRNAVESGQGAQAIDATEQSTRFAVKIIRNALAHNNLLTFGASVEQVDKLTFFSENRTGSGCKNTVDGWHVLTITVTNFEVFLQAWFGLLDKSGSYSAAAQVSVDPDAGPAR